MNFPKVLAFTAAAGLMIAQSAAASAAAPVRAGSPVAESEALGGSPGALPFLAVFAAFLVTGAVILLTDDDDSPVSP